MTRRHFLVAFCLFVAAAIEAKHIVKRHAYPHNYDTPRYSISVGCSNGDLYIDHQNCSRYYECVNGVRVPKQCPSGLEFDATDRDGRGACRNPNRIDRTNPSNFCKPGNTHFNKYNTYTTPNYNTPSYENYNSYINVIYPPFNYNNNVDCSRGGLAVDPQDCSRYYECDYGAPIGQACPPGLEFDANGNQGRGACDYPGLIDRTGPNNFCQQTSIRNIKPELQQLCFPPRSANLSMSFNKPHPSLCNAFYICSPNYIHGPCVICPQGMYFRSDGTGCEVIPNYVPQDPGFPEQQIACPDNSQRRYVPVAEQVNETRSQECGIEP